MLDTRLPISVRLPAADAALALAGGDLSVLGAREARALISDARRIPAVSRAMTYHAGSEIKLKETKIRMIRVVILTKRLTSNGNYFCKLHMLIQYSLNIIIVKKIFTASLPGPMPPSLKSAVLPL